jgi:hypothetical protein
LELAQREAAVMRSLGLTEVVFAQQIEIGKRRRAILPQMN